VDISDWLLFPRGKTIFPLLSHNNGQISLPESTKMHLLIEAELQYYQHGFLKATNVCMLYFCRNGYIIFILIL
jgi:hypothetical protein